MTELVAIGILALVILFLLMDRYSLLEQNTKEKEKLLEELSRAIKAVISKNASEYVMTASIDKVPSENKPTPPPDEIPEETLSDEEFFAAVKKGNESKK